MYVYMYVCMYGCMHVCMYICMHVCMYDTDSIMAVMTQIIIYKIQNTFGLIITTIPLCLRWCGQPKKALKECYFHYGLRLSLEI